MANSTEPEKAPMEPQDKQQDEKEKKQGLTSRQKMILIIVGIVLICATAVTVVLLLTRKPAEEEMSSVQVPLVNMENVESINKDLEEKVELGMFETHMNTTWNFPDGSTSASSNAIMGNSPNNNFAFWFTVTLSQTKETIFTSGLLPVGTQISEIVLEKELEAGKYAAVVTVNMADDDGNPIDANMGINITIIVG